VKIPWKALKVIGYIICGLFGVNLLYVLFLYAVRHEGWLFIYNPNFGNHTNSELAWQIIYSIILLLLGWGLISLSKKKLKAVEQRLK
jgi:hypothetical protein